jgi:hypothetical protein
MKRFLVPMLLAVAFSSPADAAKGGVDYAVTAEGGVLTSTQSGGSPY